MDRGREYRRGALSAWIAAACIVLMLIVTSVEAGHACDVGLYGGARQATASTTAESGHSPCLLCLGAHSPSLATLVAPAAPEVIIATNAVAVAPAHRQLLQSFALQVRPPPAV